VERSLGAGGREKVKPFPKLKKKKKVKNHTGSLQAVVVPAKHGA